MDGSRAYHGVIYDGNDFIVVGHQSFMEKCSFELHNQVRCNRINIPSPNSLNLSKYKTYPELFLVDLNFGKTPTQC